MIEHITTQDGALWRVETDATGTRTASLTRHPRSIRGVAVTWQDAAALYVRQRELTLERWPVPARRAA